MDEFLKDNGGVGYMVVALKTICDSNIKIEKESTVKHNVNSKVPVGLAATTASHGTVNLGDTVDPSAEGGKTVSKKLVAAHDIEGGQIFGIQYRDVVLEKEGKRWTRTNIAKLKNMHLVDLQNGGFVDNDNSEMKKEVIYQYDESESEEEEETSFDGCSARVL
jgi:hypothetical protein